MAEYVRTHLLDDLLAEVDQSPGQQPFKQGRDSVAGKHHATIEKDLWKFHIAFSVDGIDGHTRKLGTCQSQDVAGKSHKKSQKQKPFEMV